MQFTKIMLPGLLVLCLAGSTFGQTTAPAAPQATPDTEVESAKPDKKAKKGKRSQLELITAQQLKAFKAVDLSEEQTASLKEVITKHLPALTAAKNKLKALVTPEQRKQLAAAMKDARKNGIKPSEASGKALKSLDLGEEKTKSYVSAQAEIKALTGKIRTELLTKLTAEQRETLKPKGKGKGKDKPKGEKKKRGKKKEAAEDAESTEDADMLE